MKRDKARVDLKTQWQTGPMPAPTYAAAQAPSTAPAVQAPVFNNGWPVGSAPYNAVSPGATPNMQGAAPAPRTPDPQPQPQASGIRTAKLPTFSLPGNPAAMQLPPAKILDPPRLTVQPQESETVILPEKNGLSPNEIGPGPGAAQRAGPPPRPNSGKIEIVVSQDGGGSAAPGTPATSNSSQDSRGRRAVAYQAQLEGDYRRAVREYLKSLDGAGDEAAGIHQQIGICYQRLDDKESAITHYNDAIAEYKRQIAAGRNVEAAQSGIRACERSIKVLQ